MEERKSDTEETFGEASPPRDTSNQNAEEPPHPSVDDKPSKDDDEEDANRPSGGPG